MRARCGRCSLCVTSYRPCQRRGYDTSRERLEITLRGLEINRNFPLCERPRKSFSSPAERLNPEGDECHTGAPLLSLRRIYAQIYSTVRARARICHAEFNYSRQQSTSRRLLSSNTKLRRNAPSVCRYVIALAHLPLYVRSVYITYLIWNAEFWSRMQYYCAALTRLSEMYFITCNICVLQTRRSLISNIYNYMYRYVYLHIYKWGRSKDD